MPDDASLHLRFPFRLGPAGAATVADDTDDELLSAALYALATPRGLRPESPVFGRPDPTFDLRPARVVEAAVLGADERIRALTTEQRQGFMDTIQEEVGRR